MLRVAVHFAGLIALTVLGIIASLFAWGRTAFPEDSSPPPATAVPFAVRHAYWTYFGGDLHAAPSLGLSGFLGATRVTARDPFRWIPQARVPGHAARHFLRRSDRRLTTLRRHVAEFFASCWISAFWSPEEALTEIAQQSYYGHGFSGIHAAGQGYFGRPVVQLRPGQLAALVVISESPNRFSPWCNPAALERRSQALEPRIGAFALGQLLEGLLPEPDRACS